MRILLSIAAAAMLLGAPASAATPIAAPAKIARPPLPPAPVDQIKIGLTTRAPAVSAGAIAVCANLAGLRAMETRAAGSGFEVQRRVLDLTFALCIAGEGLTP